MKYQIKRIGFAFETFERGGFLAKFESHHYDLGATLGWDSIFLKGFGGMVLVKIPTFLSLRRFFQTKKDERNGS